MTGIGNRHSTIVDRTRRDSMSNTGTTTGQPLARWTQIAAVIAIIFGAVTILSGGRALFGGAEARAALGDIVPFVLWFNFGAGFAYVLAGIGLFRLKRRAAQLAVLIAIATALVFAALGIYSATGGAFEMRTVGAMVLRTGLWTALALLACRALGCRTPSAAGS
jgi:energy-coupling factor transporter transmembrane protein EcfT